MMAPVSQLRWTSVRNRTVVGKFDDYDMEEVKSVANITGRDIAEFLPIAGEIPIRPEVETYRLEEANRALVDLKRKPVRGAKVLVINS